MKRFIVALFLLFISANFSFADERTADVLRRINAIRQAHGLPTVSLNAKLTAAAKSQADWMASTGRTEHLRDPVTSFEQFRNGSYHPSNRVIKSGYFTFDELFNAKKNSGGFFVEPRPAANDNVGEILARGWGGPDSGRTDKIVTGWMNSPGHRHEILKREYREAGVAVTSLRPGDYYWCVVFAYR